MTPMQENMALLWLRLANFIMPLVKALVVLLVRGLWIQVRRFIKWPNRQAIFIILYLSKVSPLCYPPRFKTPPLFIVLDNLCSISPLYFSIFYFSPVLFHSLLSIFLIWSLYSLNFSLKLHFIYFHIFIPSHNVFKFNYFCLQLILIFI